MLFIELRNVNTGQYPVCRANPDSSAESDVALCSSAQSMINDFLYETAVRQRKQLEVQEHNSTARFLARQLGAFVFYRYLADHEQKRQWLHEVGSSVSSNQNEGERTG